MTPLTTWRCDSCGDEITKTTTALLTWANDPDGLATRFMLVHKNMHGRECDPGHEQGFSSSTDIANVIGPDGVAYLLSLLSVGPLKGESYSHVGDLDAFVDVFRRLQTPWYEEARPKFDDELTHQWLDDANEMYPYMPEVLESIAKGTLGG